MTSYTADKNRKCRHYEKILWFAIHSVVRSNDHRYLLRFFQVNYLKVSISGINLSIPRIDLSLSWELSLPPHLPHCKVSPSVATCGSVSWAKKGVCSGRKKEKWKEWPLG